MRSSISNIPDIIDVRLLIEMISDLGVDVTRINPDTYSFRAANVDTDKISRPVF
jgi:UDP-N-acetylglucosamine 1-carboxyvinyltransferase